MAASRNPYKGNSPFSAVDVTRRIEGKGLKWISGEYKNRSSMGVFQCPVNHKFETKFGNVFISKGLGCKQCADKMHGIKRRIPINEVQSILESFGCKLIDSNYVSANSKIKIECSSGHQYLGTIAKFKSGRRCPECAIEARKSKLIYSQKFVAETYAKQGWKLIDEYKNTAIPVNVICSKNHKTTSWFGKFLKGVGCRYCQAENTRGERHPLWNPLLTSEDRDANRTKAEKDWAKDVYKRDKYTCQSCGDRSKKLNAHHILNFKTHPELRLDISNGITFCRQCHVDFHATYGNKFNNRQQVDEFIIARSQRVCDQ